MPHPVDRYPLLKQILEALKAHPDGISIHEIRDELSLSGGEQEQLDRRLRQLDAWFHIRRARQGRTTLYILVGERAAPAGTEAIDRTTRARILYRDAQRCQMCGRTVAEDSVKLQVDHRIPREWGGGNEDENLWALCEDCNQGKRSFFASITDSAVQAAMGHASVYIRLGELLKARAGEPVSKDLLKIVGAQGARDDWERRLRDLRYIGWKYHAERRREDGRERTYFVLDHWEPWPENPDATIRRIERERRAGKS